jgi:cytochrome oxidase assembly protein ShyY1
MSNVLLTRRWLVRHILVLAAVAACVTAGSWQLHRLSERRARNARLAAQSSLPPLELKTAPGTETALRRATARGTYDAAKEIDLVERPLNGKPGGHRLTPLVLADGSAVLVDRGWAPSSIVSQDDRESLAPEGPVRVSGVLLPAERPLPLTPRTSPTGRTAARIDTEGLAPRFGYRLARVYLLLASQEPPQRRGLPAIVPPPVPEPGPPHLSYAIQWFCFAAIALGGHLLLARRGIRSE